RGRAAGAATEWGSRRRGGPPPGWGGFHDQLRPRPGYPAPISLLDEGGRLVGPAVECLEILAAYGMVLATGHVGRDEIFALATCAREQGVTRLMVTHAEFPRDRKSVV